MKTVIQAAARRRMLSAIAFASAACFGAIAHAEVPEAPGTVLSTAGGRYVFGQVSSARRDQFMLDTQTGQLWQLVCLHAAQGEPPCSKVTLVAVQYQATPDLTPEVTPQPATPRPPSQRK